MQHNNAFCFYLLCVLINESNRRELKTASWPDIKQRNFVVVHMYLTETKLCVSPQIFCSHSQSTKISSKAPSNSLYINLFARKMNHERSHSRIFQVSTRVVPVLHVIEYSEKKTDWQNDRSSRDEVLRKSRHVPFQWSGSLICLRD